MMELEGALSYLALFLTVAGIYAVLTLGLNVQWGYTGLFNIGVAGFYAAGAYTSALVTKPPDPMHLGGLGLPFPVGLLAGAAVSGLLAYLIGWITLRLRGDFLAIATIGIAEILRLVLQNEAWLANGVQGLSGIPRPMGALLGPRYNYFFLVLVLIVLALVYLGVERAVRSPWGRVLKAIREDEDVAQACGKDVFRFRLQALVLGAVIMGLAGSLWAHFIGYISPKSFEPMQATFLVWVMLIVGGSGNNKGAILGALLVWGIWSGTELVTGLLPPGLSTQAAALRVVLIGLLLTVTLILRPQGLLGEEKQVSRLIGPLGRRTARSGVSP